MSEECTGSPIDRQARLERLLANYLHSVGAGPAARPAGSCWSLAHPDLADDLQAFFRNHDSIGRLVELRSKAAGREAADDHWCVGSGAGGSQERLSVTSATTNCWPRSPAAGWESSIKPGKRTSTGLWR